MSVEDSNVIDFLQEKEDNVVLTITDHLEWEDDDNNHIYLLQEKINGYLTAIQSGQIHKHYPSTIDKQMVISVAMKYAPNDTGLVFLSKVNEVLTNAGYVFEYYIFNPDE